MNNDQQDNLTAAIAELRQRYPMWRLGRLVTNVAGWADQDVWDVEDEDPLVLCHSLVLGSFQSRLSLRERTFVRGAKDDCRSIGTCVNPA